MANIPKEKIKEVTDSVDIVDVIGNYLSLEKKGRNYVGICPFHQDTNPSLSVSPEKQIYKCFVCGNSGNAITFMKNYLHLDFLGAIEEVAKIGNIDLSGYQRTTYEIKTDPRLEPLYKMNEEAEKIYSYYINTKEGILAKDYLTNRHIDENIISKFKIGYAPKGNIIIKSLNNLKYSNIDIARSGLAIEATDYYDRFTDRIIFPIKNEHGRTIGFSGRIYIKGTGDSKYLNTNETEVFKKNEILYNYHSVKNEMKRGDSLIICEGFMDVIALAKAGINNAVALMGTALTNKHLRLLKRLTSSIILCLDGDNAGKNATIKYLTALETNGFRCQVTDLPNNLDPDEVLERQGKESLLKLINNPISPLEFKIKYYYERIDLNNYESKKEYVYQIIPEIGKLDDILDRDHYFQELVRLTDFSEATLRDIYNKEKNKKEAVVSRPVKTFSQPDKPVVNKYQKAQQELLHYMMESKDIASQYERELGFMYDKTYNIIASYIVDYYRQYQKLVISDLINEFNQMTNDENKVNQQTKVQDQIVAISELKLPQKDYKEIQKAVNDYIKTIKDITLQAKLKQLTKSLNETIDPIVKAKILADIVALKKGITNE